MNRPDRLVPQRLPSCRHLGEPAAEGHAAAQEAAATSPAMASRTPVPLEAASRASATSDKRVETARKARVCVAAKVSATMTKAMAIAQTCIRQPDGEGKAQRIRPTEA